MLLSAVIAAIIISMVILFYAVTVHRRQQLLNEKRAEYLSVKRDNSNHWKRFESSQVEVDHLRVDINARTRDLNMIFVDMERKRKEVREVLEILKDENDRVNSQMDRELSKIVDRRKQILRTHWKEMNGLKTIYIQKMQEVGQLHEGVENILSRKDAEYEKWDHTRLRMAHLKHEFEIISRSSFLSFARREN